MNMDKWQWRLLAVYLACQTIIEACETYLQWATVSPLGTIMHICLVIALAGWTVSAWRES